MRTTVAGTLLGLLMLTAQPVGAAPLGAEVQTVNGSIAAPTRFTDTENGFPGLGRRLWLANPATNGTVMYVFDVAQETWGGQFVIDTVADATGSGDMDVYLYEALGGLDTAGTGVVTTAEYNTGGPGETGFIPPRTKYAIVFTPNAVRSTFTYHGFSMPQLSITGGGDLTVPAGAFVGWVNDTADYGFVRHDVAKGQPAFDSSPGPATGLRKGEMFTHQFVDKGTFRYVTSGGTGTITVVDGPGPGTPAA